MNGQLPDWHKKGSRNRERLSKHRAAVLAIGVLVMFSGRVLASEQWICTADKAAGFYFEDGQWSEGFFDVSDVKFVIRELKNSEQDVVGHEKKYTYGVFEVGSKSPRRLCVEKSANIFCDKHFGNFYFSSESLRFLSTYVSSGYWLGDDNNENTPHMVIGKCTSL